MPIKNITYFGDSLTAGYGLSAAESFPSLLQERINETQLPYQTINAGLSGDTTTSALTRLDDALKFDFEVFVLALGANDMLRFHPAELIQKNLLTIIQKVNQVNPSAKILLLGMEVPDWLQLDAAKPYQHIYTEIAGNLKLPLVPYLLQDVFGKPQYNLGDRIHPNAKGYQLIANRVWPALKELLISLNPQ